MRRGNEDEEDLAEEERINFLRTCEGFQRKFDALLPHDVNRLHGRYAVHRQNAFLLHPLLQNAHVSLFYL